MLRHVKVRPLIKNEPTDNQKVLMKTLSNATQSQVRSGNLETIASRPFG